MQEPSGAFLVAEELDTGGNTKKIVGCCHVNWSGITNSKDPEVSGSLGMLAVMKEKSRRGIGKLLVASAGDNSRYWSNWPYEYYWPEKPRSDSVRVLGRENTLERVSPLKLVPTIILVSIGRLFGYKLKCIAPGFLPLIKHSQYILQSYRSRVFFATMREPFGQRFVWFVVYHCTHLTRVVYHFAHYEWMNIAIISLKCRGEIHVFSDIITKYIHRDQSNRTWRPLVACRADHEEKARCPWYQISSTQPPTFRASCQWHTEQLCRKELGEYKDIVIEIKVLHFQEGLCAWYGRQGYKKGKIMPYRRPEIVREGADVKMQLMKKTIWKYPHD